METSYIIIGTLLVLVIAAVTLVAFWQSQREVKRLRAYRWTLRDFATDIKISVLLHPATASQIKSRADKILADLEKESKS